ncbi:MAG TPA: glycosyltransferase family 2 protein [Candidatus Dormibacteraeota bacterium]|jgi:GT2 family glycosyltransferase|nr:glycosyltransferase family 2 protein [Candidatus Dormibacteraeota bacterium]
MSDEIAFPAVAAPDVSVVMVLHNAWEWSQRALCALVEATPPRYEVILVDNASSDGTAAGLDTVRGATVIRNARNTGFGPATNQGAAVARGRYLVLLNSDALVQPGWLQPLLDIAGAQPDVAAVGPRLVNLDGSLQEAGAIVWGNALVQNYGDGDDPGLAEYGFVRDVDYVSAACMLVRRSAFVTTGGFDSAYAPAYFEDVDLCFDLASRGMRIVYQPFSTVTHVRWASSDRGNSRALVDRNRPLFASRWADRLAQRPQQPGPAGDGRLLIEARDAALPDRVLAVCGTIPQAPGFAAAVLDAARRAVGHLEPARLTVVALLATEADTETLRRDGVEVAWGDIDWDAWLESRRSHYTVVVDVDGSGAGLDAAISRHQRPAARTGM